MTNIIIRTLSFLTIMVALSVGASAQWGVRSTTVEQKVETPQVTATQSVSTKKKSPRKARTGCTPRQKSKAPCRVTCAQVASLSQRITILENKPEDTRTWADAAELKKLQDQYDDLMRRVEKLEQDVLGLRTDVDGVNTALERFIAASGERFERVETRVGDLEGKCYAVADGNKLKNSCTGQRIKTGMGKGWKVLTLVNTGLGIAGIFLPNGGGGGNNNIAGVPPRANTGPSFPPGATTGTGISFAPLANSGGFVWQ